MNNTNVQLCSGEETALEPLVGGVTNPGKLAAHGDFWEALGSRLRDVDFQCPASQFLGTSRCPQEASQLNPSLKTLILTAIGQLTTHRTLD